MARFMLIALALVAVLVVAEANNLKAHVKAARNAFKKKDKVSDVSSDLRNTRTTQGNLNTVMADNALSNALGSSQKRGIRSPFAIKGDKGKSFKKSYEEVFYVHEFVEAVLAGYALAPCSVGLMAMADMAEQGSEPLDFFNSEVEAGLAFIEWWTENKCSEFFLSAHTFNFYVWSIFWDDLYETRCVQHLPSNADQSIDWTQAFQEFDVANMKEEDWETLDLQDECEIFELVGEIFLTYLFPEYFEAMPDYLLEDIFNDFQVNDAIDPHFGYTYFEMDKKSKLLNKMRSLNSAKSQKGR